MTVLSGGTYLVALFLSVAVSTFMTLLAVHHRNRRGGYAFGILMACFVVWSLSAGVTFLTSEALVAQVARTIMFVAIPFVPVALFFLSLQYTGRDHYVSRTTVALVSVLPVVTVLLVVTNSMHTLVWRPVGFTQVGRFSAYDVEAAIWFWVHVTYSYLLIVASSYNFVRGALSNRGTYREQSRLILAGIAVSWIANLVTLFGPWELLLDLTPVFFTVTGVFVGIAVLRFQFLDLVPVARHNVVEVMREAVLVVDDEGRVVDANPAACALVESDRPTLVGRHVASVTPDPLTAACLEDDPGSTVSLQDDAEPRLFDVRRSSLQSGARVVLLSDVTERHRQADRLERQNKQLERFASVLSHDLRNPLSVAQGYVDLLTEETDSLYTEKVVGALARMETMVDDTLELTRQGRVVTDPDPVSIGEITTDAWANVVTGSATLVVESDRTVVGDAHRIQRLLENLFRNAVEHGSTGVRTVSGGGDVVGPTVTVADLADGFVVCDDGPGIPAADRDVVLDFGYSTTESGTGLGLSIVTEIADAHGWDVHVTEAASGGARFEFSGVRTVPDAAPQESTDLVVGEEATAGSQESAADSQGSATDGKESVADSQGSDT